MFAYSKAKSDKKSSTQQSSQAQLQYWHERLSGFEVSPLLYKFVTPSIQLLLSDEERKQQKLDFTISSTLQSHIQQYSFDNNLPTPIFYLAAFYFLQSRYLQTNDLIVGAAHSSGILPLRQMVGSEHGFYFLLQEIWKNNQEDAQHVDVSYEKLTEQYGEQTLFETFFACIDETDAILTFDVDAPLTLVLTQKAEAATEFAFYFDNSRYDIAFIQKFAAHFSLILENVVKNPSTALREINFLTSEEIHQQLVTWNQTQRAYPDTTIHQLFEAQVEKIPNAIALVYEDQEMTYAELNARANQVAHYLRAQGIGSQPDMLVGLGTDRSFEMIIGILGILKAGGAYVPLDPTHPDERLRHMIEDTQISLVLTQHHLSSRWENLSTAEQSFSVVLLDQPNNFIELSKHNPLIDISLHYLAYVIYTSGTTGKPKGVMVQHSGLVNSCLEAVELLQIHSGTHALQFCSMNFDVMVLEWTSALTQGARLYLLSRRYPALEALRHVLDKHPIEVASLTPGVLRAIPEECFSHLKALCVGGEALDHPFVEKWQEKCRLVNSYGPAEATIHTSAHIYQKDIRVPAASIGKPIANMKLYVLIAV